VHDYGIRSIGMQTSSAILPVISEGPVGTVAAPEELQLKQSGSDKFNGFPLLLMQALQPLTPGAGTALPAAAAGGEDPLPLQSLPQGGKLLPLIRQFIDQASAEGLDTRQITAQVTAKIQQLQKDSDLNAAQVSVAAWYQVAAELSSQGVPGAHTLQQAIRDVLGREWPLAQSASGLPPRQQAAPMTDPSPDPGVGQHSARHGSSDGIERSVGQTLTSTLTPEQRQTELSGALAALKRLAAGGVTRSDSPARPDPLLLPVSSQPTASAPSASPVTTVPLGLDTPLNQANWAQSMGDRVQWLMSQRLQGAQIRLNPAHLGPMEVRVQIHNDQASIQFTAAHAVVRDALETALPRLREMLENSGVELVDVDISGQSFAEQRREHENPVPGRWHGNSQSTLFPGPVTETPIAAITASGRLDLFA
jgi:flagellar hook-length control protein FliK